MTHEPTEQAIRDLAGLATRQRITSEAPAPRAGAASEMFTKAECWILPSDTCRAIRSALLAAVSLVENRCAETGCMCDLNGSDCARTYRNALHDLDSTAALPGDGATGDGVDITGECGFCGMDPAVRQITVGLATVNACQECAREVR